jgi:hypothetical protein
MNAREIERALAAADPLGRAEREALARLDFGAMEADLLADAEDGFAPLAEAEPARPPHRRQGLALALGTLVVAAAIAVAIVLAGGGTDRAPRAYGAEVIRFAESTPLLLLEGPGWRVQNVDEHKTREGNEGEMEFVTGKPIPDGSTRGTGNIEEGQKIFGLQPLSVRERKVELRWRSLRQESLAEAIANRRGYLHGHRTRYIRLPVLDTTAFVDTRAEIYENVGGPHEREVVALWAEDGDLLELRAPVQSLAAFEERLGWVTKVDSQAWLEAMPAKVVKAADLSGTRREMLKGVSLPKTFAPSRIPTEGLTTSRTQVANQVAATVACLWFRQWGDAVRTGDTAARTEAERAMATSPHWPVLNPPSGETPGLASSIWQDAGEMSQGYWDFRGHHRDLLAHAEGIGCARLGLPLKPEKQKRQQEDGVPPPPD